VHAGVIAIRAPMRVVIAELERRGLVFGPPGADVSNLSGDQYNAFEVGGLSYLNDVVMLMSSNPDFIVEVSGNLDTLVVAAGEESVSGSRWLFAAERGRLLRAFLCDGDEDLESFDEGDWLSDAGFAPMDDSFDMFAALKLAGFDYHAGPDAPPNWIFELPDSVELPEGALTERLRRYERRRFGEEG
jgi:hypothetical protein